MKINVTVIGNEVKDFSKQQQRLQELRQRMLLASKNVPVVVYNSPVIPNQNLAQNSTFAQNIKYSGYTKNNLVSKKPNSVVSQNLINSKNFQKESILHGNNIYTTTKKSFKSKFLELKKSISNLEDYFVFLNLKVLRNFGILALLTTTSVLSGFYMFNQDFVESKQAVAGQVSYAGSNVDNFDAYKKWVLEKNNSQYSEPTGDLDADQLTNYEEFILQTNPKSSNTCDSKTNDLQNLLQLINPRTCKPIDFDNKEEADNIDKVISLPKIQAKIAEDSSKNSSVDNTKSTDTTTDLLNLFKVNSYEDIAKVSTEELKNASTKTLTENNLKQEYLQKIKKINDYIENNRSYETYDRDLAAPVDGAVYLEVSLKYDAPIKYVIAIARIESRFGTDRYTNSGNLTRPGQFKNIYSIGLTETGDAGYSSWEAGVEGFGKWYQKFQARGVSDCAKWRIYNPNGDYCSKVESLAKDIDLYLKS